jgi:hypothetical protein
VKKLTPDQLEALVWGPDERSRAGKQAGWTSKNIPEDRRKIPEEIAKNPWTRQNIYGTADPVEHIENRMRKDTKRAPLLMDLLKKHREQLISYDWRFRSLLGWNE